MKYAFLQQCLDTAKSQMDFVVESLLDRPFLDRQDLPPDLKAVMPTAEQELARVLAVLGFRKQSFRYLHDFDFRFGPGNAYIVLRFARGNSGDDLQQFPVDESLAKTAAGMVAWLKKEDDRSP